MGPIAPRQLGLLFLAALPLACAPAPAQDEDQAALEDQRFQDIMAEVEDLRGLEFLRPVDFKTIDAKGVDDYLSGVLERTGGKARLDFSGDVARHLGLVPADMDLERTLRGMLGQQIAGLYDPPTERFYLALGLHPAIERVTVAHELVHALDDQHFDLGAAMDSRLSNSDWLWAYQAAAEGSATAVHNRWLVNNLGKIGAEGLREVQAQGSRGLEDAPEFLWKPLLGTYLLGASFLVHSESLTRGQTAMPKPGDADRALREPPRSSEQILHPKKYWDDDHVDEPVPVTYRIAPLPDGWRVAGEDVMGELGLARLTEEGDGQGRFEPTGLLQLQFTNPAAAGWGGDRHVLLVKDERRGLVVDLVFDTEKDLEECRAALDKKAAQRGNALADVAALRGLDSSGEMFDVMGPLHLRWTLYTGIDAVQAKELAANVQVHVGARTAKIPAGN
ncbi:MAG: hypothetical protein GC161_00670 [Planctomycetaceae bacterium]|nr:hypothetical protein [Planctomycetaceae bacterium]